MGRVFGWLLLVVLGIGVASLFVGHPAQTTGQSAATATAAAATIDKSEAMQGQRKTLIEKLIREEVFQKVEMRGSAPRVWVLPRFALATFDQKQSFISAVYAYYFNGSDDTDFVRVIDAMTGNEVGQYSQVLGGLRLNR